MEDSQAWGEFTREAEGAVGYGRLQQPCKVQRTGIAVHTLLAFTFRLSLPHRLDFSPRLILSCLFHFLPFLQSRRR